MKSQRQQEGYRRLVEEISSEIDGRTSDDMTGAAPDPSAREREQGEGSEDPARPKDQPEAIQALAEACRADVSAYCLSAEELEELTELAKAAVLDPDGPSGPRIQAPIDKQYDQWVLELSIRKPKASSAVPEVQEKDPSRSGRWSRKPRGCRPTSVGVKPPSKKQLRRRLYGVIQRLYQKNRSHCAKTVLSGDWAKEKKTATLEERESYWKPLVVHWGDPGRRLFWT